MSVLLQGKRDVLTTSIAGATQDFTISGMGTPVAAIFFVSIATADNTVSNGAIESIGWTDGTHHECWSICNQNVGLGNTNNKVRADNAKVIYMLTAAGGSTGIASFNSWITDGVRITVDTQFSAAYKIGVLLIGGSEALANAGNFAGPGPGGARVVTGVGFSPDLIFFLGTKAFNASNTDIGSGMFGMAIPGGGITQRGLNWACADNSGTSDDYLCLDAAVGMLGTSANARDPFVNVTAFGSDGFTLTEIVGNNTGPAQAYLALKLPNCPIYLDYITTPTATGNADFTGPGFQPRFAAFLGCQATSTAATKTNTEASAFGLGWVAGAGTPVEHSMSCEQKDNVTSQITRSVIDTCAMTLLSDASTVSHKAVWGSWLSTGVRLGFNPTDGLTARKWAMLAIGPTTLTPGVLAHTITTFAPIIQTNIVSASPTALTTATFAPVLQTNIVAPVTALTLTTLAPVTFIIPSTAALTTAAFAPVIQTNIVLPTTALTLATFAPATMPIPTQAALVTTTFAPVLATNVVPGTAALALTTLAPASAYIPDAAALVTSTFAPVIATAVVPGTASLATSTYEPVLQAIPSAASLALSTFAPVVVTAIIPGTTALVSTSFEPVLQPIPGTAALAITTFAPGLSGTTSVVPDVASLALATFPPILPVIPDAAALTTQAFAPVLATAVIPPTAALSTTGLMPSLATDVIPSAASLAATGLAPVIETDIIVPAAALALTAFTPTVAITANGTVIPGDASLATSTFAPVLALTVVPATASLALSTFAPSLQSVLTPDVAALSTASSAPALISVLEPVAAALALTNYAPSIELVISTGSATLSLSTFAPVTTTSNDLILVPNTLGLVLTPLDPITQFGGNETVAPVTAVLLLTTNAPVLGATHMVVSTGRRVARGLTKTSNTTHGVSAAQHVRQGVIEPRERQH